MITPNDFDEKLNSKVAYEIPKDNYEYVNALTRLNYYVANSDYIEYYSKNYHPSRLIGSLIFDIEFIPYWLREKISSQYEKWGWEISIYEFKDWNRWVYNIAIRPKDNPYKFAPTLYENWQDIENQINKVNTYKEQGFFYIINETKIEQVTYVDNLLGIDIFTPSALTKDELITRDDIEKIFDRKIKSSLKFRIANWWKK